MIESLIQWIENLSQLIPLPLFVVLGSFLEEIIAPIPSPLVMTSAGTIIQSRGQSLFYILFIAIIAALSKTVASVLWYVFSDKAEDFLVSKFGNMLKISHKDIEGIGKHFNNTRRDDVLLFVLRAIPLFPNAPISIFCGIIKLNLRTYITATFAGSVVKNLLYIYAGIVSLSYLERFKSSYELVENIGYLVLVLIICYFVVKHQRSKTLMEKVLDFLKKTFRK